MHRVHRYTKLLDAIQAADHLIAHGIVARVVGDREAFGGFGVWGAGSFEVGVLERHDVPRARELLDEMTPVDEGEIDWDEALAPDLSVLDPALAPACPGCDATLPLDAALDACPTCARDVDVPALITETHGPEALAPCYEQAPPRIDERRLLSARLHCPRCHYSLEGLAVQGHCPECGHEYDKRDIVRAMME